MTAKLADTMDAPAPPVEQFRSEYRRDHIGPRYRGLAHFAVTTLGACAGIIGALAFVDLDALRAQPLQLLTLPGALVFANVVEYCAHRWLMHVERPVLGFLYKRHTLQHHRFFDADNLAATSTRDWKAVLFPAPVIVFFLGGIALPTGVALGFLVSRNVGALFAAAGAAYYLLYEWCHLAWHQPDEGAVGRLSLVRALREHHRRHHTDPTRGFNVSIPLVDWVVRR